MPPTHPLLPFEFTVAGRPVSHQSNNRVALAAWRRQVRSAAAAYWSTSPISVVPLRIVVVYYHEEWKPRIDGDNMLKPIQDALIGLVYSDDSRITDSQTRKTPIDDPFCPRRASRILLEAFAVGDEFIYVIIDDAPSHLAPLR